jgi:membrane-bound inhibitor of C-type lysozyme
MLQGYPFWSDAATPSTPTIYDPILMTAVTTIPFRGTSRKQRLMGMSVSAGTRTLGNSLRVLVGNSMPQYRLMTVPANGHQHDLGGEPQVMDINYFDLGGYEIIEGETITLSAQGLEAAAGTGAFAGVLWVEDMEPGPKAIPSGNIVCLVHGGLAASADAGTTLTDLSAALDARTLENNRTYTPFMTVLEPEDQAIEACMFRVGKNTITVPVGKMVYPQQAISFTGLEYNAGHISWWAQTAAAAGMICYMYLIESSSPGGGETPNAPDILPIQSAKIPGAVSVQDIVGVSSGTGRRPRR